ncbi:hypothetical protein [Paraburkholderia caledonica]|uniref:hypothetical protein n=1 Tax=Paraburkholderia caledonica TaxID=134536 RepID=UPI000B48F81C|nr:hypothetical protein BWU74_18175 [Burkholderia sp. Bk]
MSRRDLLTACQRLNIRTDVVAQGKRGSKDNNWLRTDIIARTYGLNVRMKWKTAAEADAMCVRAVDCCLGGFGYLLSVAQSCLKHGNDELAEYKRLRELIRRRPNDEARLLRSAGQWYELARIAQELHAVESGLKEAR